MDIRKIINNKFDKSIVLGLALLCLIGVALYANTLHSEFQLDDYEFIVSNPAIRSFDKVGSYAKVLGATRYVTFLTFALNYQWGGLNVFGYHLFNLIVHLITSVFVWWLVCLIMSLPNARDSVPDSNKNFIGLIAALLFVSHPVQTQAVTYITQRFASMGTLFYVGSLCFYLKGRLNALEGIRAAKYYILSIVLVLFGLFTKEIIITLPAMILMIEIVLIGNNPILKKESGAKLFFYGVVLFLLGFMFFLPYFSSFNLSQLLFSSRPSSSHDGDIITLGSYMLTQCKVWVVYFRLMVLPIFQNIDYDFPISNNVFEIPVLLSMTLLTLLFLGAIKFRKKNPLLSFSILWMFISLSCEMIPRSHLIFEHKVYLPSVGFFVAVSILLWKIFKDQEKLKAVVAIIVVILSVMTIARNNHWKNEISLWKDAQSKSPNKYRSNFILGKAYLRDNQLDNALLYIDRAISIIPTSYAFTNRGILFSKRKMFKDALKDFDRALSSLNGFHQAHIAYFHRGNIFMATAMEEEALSDYNNAINIKPDYLRVYNNRGSLFLRQGKHDLAFEDFNKVVFLNSNFAFGHLNRGLALRKLGQYEKAINDFDNAIFLNPNNPQAYYWRGVVYGKVGEFRKASEDFSRVLALDPKHEKAKMMKEVAEKSFN